MCQGSDAACFVRARLEHSRLDHELRFKIGYPDVSDDFVMGLTRPDARDQGGWIQKKVGSLPLFLSAEMEACHTVGGTRETSGRLQGKQRRYSFCRVPCARTCQHIVCVHTFQNISHILCVRASLHMLLCVVIRMRWSPKTRS